MLPQAPTGRAEVAARWAAAERVFESRCVVCHACYDAPCQLKLDSFAGIERGGSTQRVYDGSRLTEAAPTRLGIDASDVATWREKGFHPVVPEGPPSDPRASLLWRVLDLKMRHPLPESLDLSEAFTFALDRPQTCADASTFDAFAAAHPGWGMPYGLPTLSDPERFALTDWLETGAAYPEPAALTPAVQAAVDTWETFLNQPSLKERLMGRYLYEHLFMASLVFTGVDETSFFRLVRSRTPPGSMVDEIATRRPFDDPGSSQLYYRFVRRFGPVLAKTHLLYRLDSARLQLFRSLFLDPDYVVDALPSYEPEVGANPFRAFAAIPVRSRYRFLLAEAEFTLMGFIKGPVCRGQVALNVIQDRFWITFVDPDVRWMVDATAFLASQKVNLDMPAERGSSTLRGLWDGYEPEHDAYMKQRGVFLGRETADGGSIDLEAIWDGDGHNTNAALTVFRHFDSATVLRGLLGGPPRSAWVIDYPLLERIHYLLVAGFDVFGNVGHQLSTRVYMDFLRMEGEAAFLMFLPPSRRDVLIASWYREVSGRGKTRVETDLRGTTGAPRIAYRTAAPELELFEQLRARVAAVLAHRHELAGGEGALSRLQNVRGSPASWMPEVSFLSVNDGHERTHFTILRESAHTNVAQLFDESARRVQAEDALAVLPGLVGAYPNALYEIDERDLETFVDTVGKLQSAADYRALRLRFGVLRNSPRFWPHSDVINRANRQADSGDGGLVDYSHLEAL